MSEICTHLHSFSTSKINEAKEYYRRANKKLLVSLVDLDEDTDFVMSLEFS